VAKRWRRGGRIGRRGGSKEEASRRAADVKRDGIASGCMSHMISARLILELAMVASDLCLGLRAGLTVEMAVESMVGGGRLEVGG
jgi:hypothetical protein